MVNLLKQVQLFIVKEELKFIQEKTLEEVKMILYTQ